MLRKKQLTAAEKDRTERKLTAAPAAARQSVGRASAPRKIGRQARIRSRNSAASAKHSQPLLYLPADTSNAAPPAAVTSASSRRVLLATLTPKRLDTISEEAMLQSRLPTVGVSDSDTANEDLAAGSSYPSAELEELNTAEIFADCAANIVEQVAVVNSETWSEPSTSLSRSARATAGSFLSDPSATLNRPSPVIKLERMSVKPITDSQQATPTETLARYVDAAELTSTVPHSPFAEWHLPSHSPQLKQPNLPAIRQLQASQCAGFNFGNLLLDDPVSRGFLTGDDLDGCSASSSFDVPTRDAEASPQSAREVRVWVQDQARTNCFNTHWAAASVDLIGIISSSSTEAYGRLEVMRRTLLTRDVAASGVGTKGVNCEKLKANSQRPTFPVVAATDVAAAQLGRGASGSREESPSDNLPIAGTEDRGTDKPQKKQQYQKLMDYLGQPQQQQRFLSSGGGADGSDGVRRGGVCDSVGGGQMPDRKTTEDATAARGTQRCPDRFLNLGSTRRLLTADRVLHSNCGPKLNCCTVRRSGHSCPDHLIDYRNRLQQLMRFYRAEQQCECSRCTCHCSSQSTRNLGGCSNCCGCCGDGGGGCANGMRNHNQHQSCKLTSSAAARHYCYCCCCCGGGGGGRCGNGGGRCAGGGMRRCCSQNQRQCCQVPCSSTAARRCCCCRTGGGEGCCGRSVLPPQPPLICCCRPTHLYSSAEARICDGGLGIASRPGRSGLGLADCEAATAGTDQPRSGNCSTGYRPSWAKQPTSRKSSGGGDVGGAAVSSSPDEPGDAKPPWQARK